MIRNSFVVSPAKALVKSGSMPFWEESELRKFYQAYHKHGNNWTKVVKVLNYSKNDDDCEALWRMQKTLLSLQNNKIMEDAFVASVNDAQDNVLRASTPRHGAAADGNKASDSNHSGSTSSLQATAKKRRTPRGRKVLEPAADISRGGRGSPAHPQGFNQGTPTHGRKAPGTPTWPNGRPSVLNGSPAAHRGTPSEPPSSGHKRKRHRKLFEDDASPRRFPASGGMSPERPSSHNSTFQNGQKHHPAAWRRPMAGGPPEQPQEDVGAADALLSLKAMPRTGCPPPVPPSAHQIAAAEQELAERLHRSNSLSRQEDEGESPDLKAPAGLPQHRLPRKISRREPNTRPSLRASSGDDYHDAGSTPPTASPSASYPGPPQDRWESMSGQATSAMKRMRATMGSSIDPMQAHSTPAPSSDNAMLTITVPMGHENARDVSSLAAEPSTASEGPAPSSQLSGGPLPPGHDGLMSHRNPYLPTHNMLPQPYSHHDSIHPHSMVASTGQHQAMYDPQRRVMTPLSVRQHATASARWLQQLPPPMSGRHSQRKPLPEKLPPMAPSLAKLLSRTSLQGPGSFAGYAASGSMSSAFVPHGALQKLPVGETGEAIGPAETTLRHSLSTRLRRWCMYEFLYSAIDRPYFMRNEWSEFLRHIGLGELTKLTRTEWSLIRSGSFGRPRRLSQAFLKSERIRLEAYRVSVRMLYENSQGGDLPANIPKPLYVGQHVTARHPMTRQIHDGVILTGANKDNKYRVQFHRTELMTEMIRDVDVMPVDPIENLPPLMLPVNTTLNGRLGNSTLGPRRRKSVPAPLVGPAAGRAQQDARTAQAPPPLPEPANEADAALALEVESLLNMKDALIAQLTNLNNQAEARREVGREYEFQVDYSTVVVQLGKVNDQLKCSLEKLLGQSPHLLGMAKPLHAPPGTAANTQPVTSGPESAPIAPPQPLQPLRSSSPRHNSPYMMPSARTHSANVDAGAPHLPKPQVPGPSAPSGPIPSLEPQHTAPPNHVSAKTIVDNAMREARDLVTQHSLRNRDSMSPPKPDGGPDASHSQPGSTGTHTDAGPGKPDDTTIPQDSKMSTLGKDTATDSSTGHRLSENPVEVSRPNAGPEQNHGSAQGTDIGNPEQAVQAVQAGPCSSLVVGGQARETQMDKRQALVEDVITGCVGMLFTVQQCTRNNVSEPTLEGALDMVLQMLKPRVSGNLGVFHDIADAVGTLKVQLANSS